MVNSLNDSRRLRAALNTAIDDSRTIQLERNRVAEKLRAVDGDFSLGLIRTHERDRRHADFTAQLEGLDVRVREAQRGIDAARAALGTAIDAGRPAAIKEADALALERLRLLEGFLAVEAELRELRDTFGPTLPLQFPVDVTTWVAALRQARQA